MARAQVGLVKGELAFGLSPPMTLPDGLEPTGDEAEYAPALELLTDKLTKRFSDQPGSALFVDYGPDAGAPADTLRAYRDGRQVHPLSEPGASDLTADVDFARLAKLTRAAGLRADGPVTQGALLAQLGARVRQQALASANPDRADEVTRAVDILLSPSEMGERFKAIAIGAPSMGPAPGF